MFHERRAPQERCDQLWCSSKPGGVIVPPELLELTFCLYSSNSSNASEERVNTRFPQRPVNGRQKIEQLFNEESFPQLVAANERFHRPEA